MKTRFKLKVKQCLLILLFAFVTAANWGQELNDQNYKKNEIKINALYLILGGVEITYERNLNEESSFGVSGLFSFDNFGIDTSLTGYFRFYFGEKPAAGFFAEAFTMLNTNKSIEYNPITLMDVTKNRTDLALGISIGGKFITKKGLVAEIFTGVGRNLGSKNEYEFVPRFGITIGKRF